MTETPAARQQGQDVRDAAPSQDATTATQGGEVLAAPLSAARRLLPDSPVPAVLAGSALALAGVLEWPAVAAIGLGYAALRRWHRST